MRISDWSSDVCSSDLFDAGDFERNRGLRYEKDAVICQIRGNVDHCIFAFSSTVSRSLAGSDIFGTIGRIGNCTVEGFFRQTVLHGRIEDRPANDFCVGEEAPCKLAIGFVEFYTSEIEISW